MLYLLNMDNNIDKVAPILRRYGVKKAAFFGSYARGEQTDSSDVDILIQLPPDMGLAFVRLQRELQGTLGKSVDLVSYDGISPYMRESILSHQVTIL